MTKEKKIKSDVFLCDVHILVTDNPDKCVDDRNLRIYCSDSPDEDLSKNCAGFVFQKRISDYYVVIPANVKYSVITHESVHLIGRIFRDRGQEADYNNDEVFAYYVGWIAGEIAEYVKKVYDCF